LWSDITAVNPVLRQLGGTEVVLFHFFAASWRPFHVARILASNAITGYITGYRRRSIMSNTSQNRAIKNYRSRLRKRGVARFEVLGLDADRELIRSLAKRLAQDDPEASRIRSEVTRTVSNILPKKGGILAALRRSPLVGMELEIDRPLDAGRQVDL
jgi:hypothetical protein